MIGADIVVPKNVEFPWLQNSARSAARKLVTLLLMAQAAQQVASARSAARKKAAQKTAPETKPEVVRFAGQSSALQLPKHAGC